MRRCFLICCALVLLVPTLAIRAVAQEAHTHIHSHRGPGPHFIDAFFVENAYLERKIRPDIFFTSGEDGKEYTGMVEVEYAVAPRLALIVHAPFRSIVSDLGERESGIGDISVGAKFALVNDKERFILAIGSDLEIPTGDAMRGLGEEHAAAAPFLLAWLPFGQERRFTLQTAAHMDIPFGGDDEETHLEIGNALSWTSPLGLTPMFETLVHVDTETGDATWAIAPGFRYEFAHAWELGATVQVPVGGHQHEDYTLGFGMIHHFEIPWH